jgi:hypothetical protein
MTALLESNNLTGGPPSSDPTNTAEFGPDAR